jgi:hypothetical protein
MWAAVGVSESISMSLNMLRKKIIIEQLPTLISSSPHSVSCKDLMHFACRTFEHQPTSWQRNQFMHCRLIQKTSPYRQGWEHFPKPHSFKVWRSWRERGTGFGTGLCKRRTELSSEVSLVDRSTPVLSVRMKFDIFLETHDGSWNYSSCLSSLLSHCCH